MLQSARTLLFSSALAVLCGCTAGGGGGKESPPTDEDGVGSPDATADVKTSCLYDEDCPDTGEACTAYACVESECVLGNRPEGEACDTDACMSGQTCLEGTCQGGKPAPPACDVDTCVPDACGNPCACAEGLECVDGACEAAACGDLTYEGCCMPGETVVVWCENDEVNEVDCGENDAICTWSEANAFYACGAADTPPVSGPSEFPYLCAGETCDGSCEGKSCGSDGCGNSCGACGDNAYCVDGACQECSCEGLECGLDPCGNECGTCEGDAICLDFVCYNDPCQFTTMEGCCKGDVLHYCETGEPTVTACDQGCGWDPNGNNGAGWYDCGFEGEDPTGLFPLQCFDPLDPPTCDTAEDCPNSVEACKVFACSDGVCVQENKDDGEPCDTDPCFESQACMSGECQGGAQVPKACDGLECGPDACGQSCGECVDSMTCEAGQCVPDLPATYTLDVQPILLEHCSPCHTEQKLGGHNIAASYPDATKSATHPDCVGQSVGECSVTRILNFDMPKSSPGSVPPQDLQVLEKWLADGMLL